MPEKPTPRENVQPIDTSLPPGRRPVRIPQQARSRRTREAVLEAAIHCFETQGFDETTTALIARRAGIAVGTLYGYFRDKEEILLELLDTTVADVADLVIERLAPEHWDGADPRDTARALIDTLFHSQRVRPGLQRIMWERYFKDEAFRRPFEAIRSRAREAILEFANALSAQGLLRDIDPESASYVILNAVQWNATQVFLFGSNEEIDARAEATADLVIRYVFRD
jgi:AcrR family transcriptional regulator